MSILEIKDRIPTQVLDNGAIRYGVYDENNNLLRYEYMKREDEPIEEGTPVNKVLIDIIASKLIGYNVLNDVEIELDKIENDFSKMTSKTVFNSGFTLYTSCTTLGNGNVLIAYRDADNSGYGTFVIVSQSGNIVKSEMVFNSGSTTEISSTTLANGNALIAYTDGDNSNYGTFVIVDQNGNIVKNETVFNNGTTYDISSTSLGNGNVLIAYRDVGNNQYGTFIIVDQDYFMLYSSNSVNNIEIDTLLSNGFYELLYDGKFIAKEVRV